MRPTPTPSCQPPRPSSPLCRAALDASSNPLGRTLSTLSTLSRLTALAELDVSRCSLLSSLEGLPTGGALTSLEASSCKLTDLGPLAGCGK